MMCLGPNRVLLEILVLPDLLGPVEPRWVQWRGERMTEHLQTCISLLIT